METLKIKFIKAHSFLFKIMLGLIGITSCKQAALYGTPHADFIVKGNIQSKAENKPIAQIQVLMSSDSLFRRKDSINSDDKGNYHVRWSEFPVSQKFYLRFIDKDGMSNGGEFKTKDTAILFKDPKFIGGDGDWYSGKTEQTLDIKLTNKTN